MSPSLARAVHRGELWVARLSPVVGAEMDKTRPVLIISADGLGALPVKLAAPCTTTPLSAAPWRVPIAATERNGLDRDTTVDLMQIRALSVARLTHRLGTVEPELMEDVAAIVATIVEYV
jgi:mRNA interferase MazF